MLHLTHLSAMNNRSAPASRGVVGITNYPKFTTAIRTTLMIVAMIGAAAQGAICADPAAQFGYRVIRRVSIVRQNVFTDEEQKKGLFGDDPWMDQFPLGAEIRRLHGPGKLDVMGWANRIHFKTRPTVIKRELLFEQGDVDDPRVLAETERNLRALGLFRSASVTLAAPDGEGSPNQADVEVLTQDAWTLVPQASLSLLGGSNVTGGIGVAEYNLFGYGKAVKFFHSSELYRNVDVVGYNDPSVWGTHWHLLAEGSEDSDGRIRSALVEYPFYSLEVPFSVTLAPSYIVDRERLFSIPANNPITFRRNQTAIAAEGDFALAATRDLVRRIGLRYEEWDDTFTSPTNNHTVASLGLQDRRPHALEVTYTEWWPKFIKTYFLDKLGHPEDTDLDFAYGLRLGYSTSAIGASAHELVLGRSLSLGAKLGADTYSWLYLQTARRARPGRLPFSSLS